MNMILLLEVVGSALFLGGVWMLFGFPVCALVTGVFFVFLASQASKQKRIEDEKKGGAL